jgi:hypothetical protein
MSENHPPSLALALARTVSISQAEYLGFRQVFQELMPALGPMREAVKSSKPIPLRPGVSATLEEIDMSNHCKENLYEAVSSHNSSQQKPVAAGATARSCGDESTSGIYEPSTVAVSTASKNTTMANPTKKDRIVLNKHFDMTFTLQRGCPDNSLNSLCETAGLMLPSKQKQSWLPSKTDSDECRNRLVLAQWENAMKLSSNATSGLNLGVNDQNLMDDFNAEGDMNAGKQPILVNQLKRRADITFLGDHGQQSPAKRHSTKSTSAKI